MTWRALVLAVLLLAAAPLAASRTAGGRAATFCDVIALDSGGQPATGLTSGDFDLQVDGAAVPATQVSRTPAEMDLVMLVDGTASQPLKRYELFAAVYELRVNGQPVVRVEARTSGQVGEESGLIPNLLSGDRARLARLGDPTVIGAPLSADRTAAIAAARTFLDRPPLEPSPIWDAIDMTVKALAGATRPRVLLLVSDGRANANIISLDEAGQRAIAAGVSINVVSEGGEWLIPQFGDAPDRARSDVSLRWLADQTGGMFLEDGTARRTLKPQMNAFAYVRELTNTPNRPAPLVQAILAALHQRYRLSFDAPADGRIHSLEVRAKRADVTIRAPKRFVVK
jgi:hypothetical protein